MEKNLMQDFKKIINVFLDNIQSLKAYTEKVEPILKNSEEDEKFGPLIEGIGYILHYKKYKDDQDAELLKVFEEIEEQLSDKLGVRFIENEDGKWNVGVQPSFFNDEFKESVENVFIQRKQIPLLYKSSLISLVIYFELLIASLLRKKIYEHPESAKIYENSLKFDEIKRLGSLENALLYLVEKEVDHKLRESFIDWLSYFRNNYKCKFKDLNSIEQEVFEIFQRRNVHVHNDGIVNNIYITKVDEVFRNGLKVGDKLEISKSYIERAIDLIEMSGIIVLLEVWQRHEKNCQERIDYIYEIGYSYLKKEKWELAQFIYNFILEEKDVKDRDKSVSLINIWLCKKNLGFDKEVQEELRKADFSDKMDDLKLCYYALCENENEFFELLEKMYDKDIPKYHVHTWPVLRNMREKPKFKMFVESLRASNNNSSNVVLIENSVATTNENDDSLENLIR